MRLPGMVAVARHHGKVTAAAAEKQAAESPCEARGPLAGAPLLHGQNGESRDQAQDTTVPVAEVQGRLNAPPRWKMDLGAGAGACRLSLPRSLVTPFRED